MTKKSLFGLLAAAICSTVSAQNMVDRTPTTFTVPGSKNTLIGVHSVGASDSVDNWDLWQNGHYNSAFGHRALRHFETGNDNTAIGAAALDNLSVGEANTGLGRIAFRDLQTGDRNVAVGRGAGWKLQNGSGNIFIGANTGPGTDTNFSNRLYIHNGGTDTPMIYGEFNTRILRFNVTGPNARTEIVGNANSSGLRFTNLTNATTPIPNNTSNKFLTVNNNGDVVLEQLVAGGTSPTYIVDGLNTTVTGDGSSSTPFVINSPSQTLSVNNNILTISNGNSVTLPGSADTSLYLNDGTIVNTQNHLRTVVMRNNDLWFSTKESEKKYGKIYIGNDPGFIQETGRYRLFVEGGILTEKVKVALRYEGNWADYVFADDYDLMPLADVEEFIKENKHLPGIDSAADLVKNGLDLGDMQAKQMEKIEELTLYLIQQNKVLEKQIIEINELKDQVKALLAKQ